MKKQYQGFVFIGVISILLSLLYCPPWDIFYDDKEIFRYTGLVIRSGGVPYRDFFDHKPPLIFFLNAVGGVWGVWIIDALLTLTATWLFFNAGKRYRLALPWLPPLFFNLMLRNYMTCEGIGMTREYTALLLVISFCLVISDYRPRFFLLGIISGLTFFMQQDQLLLLAPFLCWAVIRPPYFSPLKKIGLLAFGFLAATSPILLYFMAHQSLTIFWEDAFLFNFSWYTSQKQSLANLFRSLKYGLDATNLEIAFIVPVILGIAVLFMRKGQKGLIVAALAAVLFSFSPEYLSGNLLPVNFYYYLTPLAATLSILIFVVFSFSERLPALDRIPQILYGIILCCSLGYNSIQHAAHLRRSIDIVEANKPLFRYLDDLRLTDRQLYVFGNSPFIYTYNRYQILAPSRWIYHHFWSRYPGWDSNLSILKSIGADLLKYKTTYILDFSAIAHFQDPAKFLWWQSFLEAHYEKVQVAGYDKPLVWKIRNTYCQ